MRSSLSEILLFLSDNTTRLAHVFLTNPLVCAQCAIEPTIAQRNAAATAATLNGASFVRPSIFPDLSPVFEAAALRFVFAAIAMDKELRVVAALDVVRAGELTTAKPCVDAQSARSSRVAADLIAAIGSGDRLARPPERGVRCAGGPLCHKFRVFLYQSLLVGRRFEIGHVTRFGGASHQPASPAARG